MKYLVKEDAQLYVEHSITSLLVVESPAWFAWLEGVAHFTFQCQYGAFSARKERIANGRGGSYWRAYRKKQGKLCRVYLGKNEQVTMARLNAVALELARRLEAGESGHAERAMPLSSQPVSAASQTSGEKRQIARTGAAHYLLRTKFHIPVFQARLVERDRLIQHLNRGVRQRLVLLSAAAGSGKTTLLGAWARQSAARIAWVALDAEENDPVRFWSYILAALQDASFEGVAYLLETLRALPLTSFQPMLNELLKVLDENEREVVIILDDYHLIEMQTIHESLAYFLAHLPAHVHLVLSSRYELPFSVAQLRVRNQLVELHSADLSFTPAEAEIFFVQAEHFALTRDDLKILVERTEGWIAGLQLAALAMRTQQDTTQFISGLNGSQRFLMSYLVDEVLERQPEDVKHFLLATSVLDRFTAGLCDALTGEENGVRMLAYLEHRNLFLFSLDSESYWYRYHHLLAEAMRSRVLQIHPARFRELHRLASVWFEQHALLEEAVHHALAATDVERSADLLERLVDTMLQQNEFASVARWQELLPPEVLDERPWLRLAWARIYLASGHLDWAEETLRDLESSGIEKISANAVNMFRGRVAALYAHLYGTRGEAQESLTCASQALALLPEDDLEWQISVRTAMGGAYLHAGNLVEADLALSEVVSQSLQKQDPYHALTTLHPLGQTQVLLGRPGMANETYLRGIQIASRYGLTRSAVMGHIHAGRGYLLYEWNDLEGAQDHLVTGLELARRGENTIQALDCTLTLSDVRQAQGRMQDAFTLLQQAQELARQTNDPFFLDFVTRRPVFLLLAANDVGSAASCARATGLCHYGEVDDITSLPSTFFLLIELLILVRLYLAQDDLSSANRLLTQLQAPLANGPNKRRRIQWLILHALALHAEQHISEATGELAQALELAEPLGYIRTFIDTGKAMLPLLRTLHKLKPLANYSQNYIRRLLSALGAQEPEGTFAEGGAGAELLSEREFMVLRCLAEGRTNREIAQRLVLTENTIKTHTKHLYSKLNVHSRTRAIARARELGLLS